MIHQKRAPATKNDVKTDSYGAKNGAGNGTAALSGRISGPLQYQEVRSFGGGEADGAGDGEIFFSAEGGPRSRAGRNGRELAPASCRAARNRYLDLVLVSG